MEMVREREIGRCMIRLGTEIDGFNIVLIRFWKRINDPNKKNSHIVNVKDATMPAMQLGKRCCPTQRALSKRSRRRSWPHPLPQRRKRGVTASCEAKENQLSIY